MKTVVLALLLSFPLLAPLASAQEPLSVSCVPTKVGFHTVFQIVNSNRELVGISYYSSLENCTNVANRAKGNLICVWEAVTPVLGSVAVYDMDGQKIGGDFDDWESCWASLGVK